MFERAPKPIARAAPIRRAPGRLAPEADDVPAMPAAALPKRGFADLAVHPPRPGNRTGLPDRLRRSVEALSGQSLEDVAVHYNSPRPAEVAARAFARGREIHLAPGQERHLPHEAWHLVQQAQGRVRPRMEVPGGGAVNDETGLEREASVMGSRAVQANPQIAARPAAQPARSPSGAAGPAVMQPYWEIGPDGKTFWVYGMAPKGHVQSDRTKGGQPVWMSPETARIVAERTESAKKEKEDRLEKAASDRAIRTRSRREFSSPERRRLESLPKVVTREDRNPEKTENSRGLGKAHLIAEGLETAGRSDISATEQEDAESRRKGTGNRISSKAPLRKGQVDRSQSYGGKLIGIKAQKLERARLRGKPDAQHVQVHTTDEIQDEIEHGPETSEGGRTKEELKGLARKDREFHHSVRFFSAKDPRHYIPRRFLALGDGDIHDSDSDEESGPDSDTERKESRSERSPTLKPRPSLSSGYRYGLGPASSSSSGHDRGSTSSTSHGATSPMARPPVPQNRPWMWDEDYGMHRQYPAPRESDDMDHPEDE